MSDRKKSVSQAFRLDVKTHDALVEEALKQRVSLNVLVNHVLEDYATYDRFAERTHVIRIGPPIVASFINEMSDETIIALGERFGAGHPKIVLVTVLLPFTLENVIRLVEVFLCRNAKWYTDCEFNRQQDVWEIYLSHVINRKWSLYLCEYMASLFSTLKFQPKEKIIEDYSTTLLLKIPNKSENPYRETKRS